MGLSGKQTKHNRGGNPPLFIFSIITYYKNNIKSTYK